MDLLAFSMAMFVMAAVVHSNRPRIIDLTHQLTPDTPIYPVYPKFNFTIMHRGYYGDRVEYNYIGTVEHVGTHMDAPEQTSRGGLRIHEISIDRFMGPGVVIRVTEKARENVGYHMTVDDILEWEAAHGQIPDNAIVMMDSGWTHTFSDHQAFFGTKNITDLSTYHFPSISVEAAQFIKQYRQLQHLLDASYGS